MKNTKTKLLNLALIAVVLAFSTVNNKAFAACSAFSCDDQKYAEFLAMEDLTVNQLGNEYNLGVLPTYKNINPLYNGGSIMKFNISPLVGSIPLSATLSMYGLGSSINVYYITDDSWTEASDKTWTEWLSLVGNKISEGEIGTELNWYDFNLDLTQFDLTNDFNDGYLSLAFYDSSAGSVSVFGSSESSFIPKLGISYCETIVGNPVPEPATSILGLLGVSGLLGLKKRNKR